MPARPAAKTSLPRATDRSAPKVYLVGGGIASLAVAAFMIRDGDMFGHNITILEESSRIGGSLDGAGSPQEGYVLRGGRMLESKYLCTFDLFSSIPTLDERETVTQEIMRWNETMRTSSKARLVRNGRCVTAPDFGLIPKLLAADSRACPTRCRSDSVTGCLGARHADPAACRL